MLDESIMSKIKALLAMAEHAGSNPNEAAIAMEKAQTLLLRHNLTRAEIAGDGPAAPAGIGKIDVTEETGYSWKSTLLYALARFNLCSTVSTPSTGTSHLFGGYDNVQSVLEMYHWLKPELDRLALAAWVSYQQDGTGGANARSWKTSFYLAAIGAIERKLGPGLESFRQGEGRAIVPYTEEAVKAAVHRLFPHLRTTYSTSRNHDGAAAGRRAGDSLSLRPTRKLSGAYALGAGRSSS